MNKGILYGLGCYTLWGFLPIYWKLIENIPSLEIVGHRTLWSFVFVLTYVVATKAWNGFQPIRVNSKILLVYLATGVLMSANWLIYIWAVNSGYIIESSLGYFINPLVNVSLGVIFLREKLRLWQWIPVGLAALGVGYLTVSYGELPWIALSLAFTFGFYGLIKKTAALDSISGFTIETGFVVLPALAWLLYLEFVGRGAFGHGTALETLLLILAGVATGLPLLWFGAAARRVPLSTLGFLQYIAPTFQFLIGVFIYGEDFSQDRVIGFCIIWTALLIFSIDGIFNRRRSTLPAPMD
ncbi:MAG: EamA family transporter RarD [Anaerolineales bacterium]|nr:EamA family transporter RarD [Chloroflexota bacterium]MBL6983135.1 EamA family transporter RarD [Anaerolineales bacterium]